MEKKSKKNPKTTPTENHNRDVEVLRRATKNMMHLADLIIFEGGPKEICDLIKQHGQRALDSTSRHEENNK